MSPPDAIDRVVAASLPLAALRGIRPEHITTGRWPDKKHVRSSVIESVTPSGAQNLVRARLGDAGIAMLVNALEHSETDSSVELDVQSTLFSVFDEKTGQRL